MAMSEFTVRLVGWREAGALLKSVRHAVFVEEQRVPENLEWDGRDPECAHALATDLAGCPIGTARLSPDGHIGRMAVLSGWRRKGIGSALLRLLLFEARKRGYREVRLHAQTHAAEFYAKFGFERSGEEFPEAGIPHVEMALPLRDMQADRP